MKPSDKFIYNKNDKLDIKDDKGKSVSPKRGPPKKEAGVFDGVSFVRKLASAITSRTPVPVAKVAAAPATLFAVAGREVDVIDRLVSQRVQVDWITSDYDRSERMKRMTPEEFALAEQEATKAFEEVNAQIKKMVTTVFRRALAFCKEGVKELTALNYKIHLGKFESTVGTSKYDWADYTFRQEIQVKDLLNGSQKVYTLVWSARSKLDIYERRQEGNEFSSEGWGRNFDFAKILIFATRPYDAHRIKWDEFVESRKKTGN